MISDLDWPAQRVMELRAKLGLTQVDFGNKIGVSRVTIWKLEKGFQTRVRDALVIDKLQRLERAQSGSEGLIVAPPR